MLVLSGAVFMLSAPDMQIAQAQPAAMDMPQRARVAAASVQRHLQAAGSGLDAGPITGPLSPFFAPVIPRRMGLNDADPFTAARSDALTI
jgi:hypothetical protein